jgi:hypothetical protein
MLYRLVKPLDAAFRPILLGADLNVVSAHLDKIPEPRLWELCHELRQDTVCADHGVPPLDELWTHRGSLVEHCWRATLDMRRTTSPHGVCSGYVARFAARHRGDTGVQQQQAVCGGVVPPRTSLDLGRYERSERLAHLVRFGCFTHSSCTKLLQRYRPRP